ncbi:MAG: DUF167 domain-containing protein [Candidatus Nanoarchaeia archaeon]|nr:DUF167 domain-containing protein [Candidatus Nanoarchaeia archaeon]
MNICPKCKSLSVKCLNNVDYRVVALGASVVFRCLNCKFEGPIFPEIKTLNIKVKPNSKKNEIILKDGNYEIKIKAPPEDNKANLELVKFLSKEFKTKIRIKAGFTGKNKIIEFN